jgi:hypothetical protein
VAQKPTSLSSLIFTPAFLEELCSKKFSVTDRKKFLRALALLDSNEKHPSLGVHELQVELAGEWPAKASDSLRMTFERVQGGKKLMLGCTHHYAR